MLHVNRERRYLRRASGGGPGRVQEESAVKTGAGEMLRCWRGRWEERSVVLTVGGFVLAFVLGAAVLVREYSTPAVEAVGSDAPPRG